MSAQDISPDPGHTAPIEPSEPAKATHQFLRKGSGHGGNLGSQDLASLRLPDSASNNHHEASDRGLNNYVSHSGTNDGRRPWSPVTQPAQASETLPWHIDQTIWLGLEGDEENFIDKARLLATDTIVSIGAAVEGLNRGTLKCSEDFCIAYSMSNRGYYLLYRRGLREQAAALVARPSEVVAAVASRASLPSAESEGTLPAGSMTLLPSAKTEPAAALQPQLLPRQPLPQANQQVAPGSAAAVPAAAVTGPEETLLEQLRGGLQPSEEVFDSAIAAVGADATPESVAKIEEWLMLALEMEVAISEASFNTVVVASCKAGLPEKAEDVLLQMMQLGRRPSKEIFDVIIRLFSDRGDALKVEEWLLHAGQSGWTPESPAFEAVVLLYAQIDAAKAEEWLSRAQQTEYRLSDMCFEAVVKAFVRVGNHKKAHDWLSRMLNDDRHPSEATLHQSVTLLIGAGDVPNAEIWLAQLAARPNAAIESPCLALFNAAMRAGDLACAERQLEALGDTDPGRTENVAMAYANRGDAARAKAVLERYRSLGGAPTQEINLAMLSTCATAGDREGAEAIARMLAHTGHLSKSEVPVLAQVMGDSTANAFYHELTKKSGDRQAAEAVQPARTPATDGPAAAPKRHTGGSGTGSARANSKAAAKAAVRRGGGGGGRGTRSPR